MDSAPVTQPICEMYGICITVTQQFIQSIILYAIVNLKALMVLICVETNQPGS